MGVGNGTEFGEESVAILSGRVDADALVQLHFCEHTRAMQGISQSMRRMGESWSESMSWSPEPEQQRGDLRDELQRSLRWSGAAASTSMRSRRQLSAWKLPLLRCVWCSRV